MTRDNPGLAGFREFLVVFAEPPTPAQPGQCALHHPPAGQHLELMAVRVPAHHLQQPSAGRPNPPHQPAPIGCVSPDDLEPWEPSQQFGQHQSRTVPVLDVGGMNDHRQEQPSGVHYDVALASRHLFAGVIAARPPFSVVLTDWLSMIAPPSASSGGGGIPPLALPDHGTQCLLKLLPGTIFAPFPEVPPDRTPRRQVMGHHSPRNAAPQDIQNAVHYLSQIRGAGVALLRIRGQQGLQKVPLGISQISRICFSAHAPTVSTTPS